MKCIAFTAYDGSNDPVATDFTWLSLDPAAVQVDDNGLVTVGGTTRGPTRIRATAQNGVSGVARLQVRQVIKTVGLTNKEDTINATAARMVIDAGASLSIDPGYVLTVAGTLLGDGPIDGFGFVRLTGATLSGVQSQVNDPEMLGTYKTTAPLTVTTLLPIGGARLETDGYAIVIDIDNAGVGSGSVTAGVRQPAAPQPTRVLPDDNTGRAKKPIPPVAKSTKAEAADQ